MSERTLRFVIEVRLGADTRFLFNEPQIARALGHHVSAFFTNSTAGTMPDVSIKPLPPTDAAPAARQEPKLGKL